MTTYSGNNSASGRQVELRKIDDDGELDLCRDLTEAANDHDKPWRSQFEKHLLEMKS